MSNWTSKLPAIGTEAPDFQATSADGQTHTLSQYRGKANVVLVFYPGNYTPVCTAQLCSFRDHWNDIQTKDTIVLGINPANVGRLKGFAESRKFPFPLLADEGTQIASKYGCRILPGIINRSVIVIDHEGKIVYAQRGNPSPETILPYLKPLGEQDKTATTPHQDR